MSPHRLAYSVPPWLVAASAAASLVAFAAAARGDGPGRFLFLVLGVVAAAEALRSALLRPTLTADSYGITVVPWFRRERHAWAAVAAVTVLGAPEGGGARLRRRANAVEVDLGERLLVVPAYRLGAPAADVVAALASLRGMRTEES